MTSRGRPDIGVTQGVRDCAVPAGALFPNTLRRPEPPQPYRFSMAGSISCSRKSSHAPVAAELMYWLPPSRVKQSGKATTTGGIADQPVEALRQVLSEADPIRVRQPTAREAHEVDQQRQI